MSKSFENANTINGAATTTSGRQFHKHFNKHTNKRCTFLILGLHDFSPQIPFHLFIYLFFNKRTTKKNRKEKQPSKCVNFAFDITE